MEYLLSEDNVVKNLPCRQYIIGFSALVYYNQRKRNDNTLISIKLSD